MIIITGLFKQMHTDAKLRQASGSSGFTLVELIMATAISGIILASMVGTFLTFALGARGVGAYTQMSKSSRMALEYFARDMRSAEDVRLVTESSLTIVAPSSGFYTGSEVTYDYDSDAKVLFRIERDAAANEISNQILLEGVEAFTFSYFDPLGKSLSASSPSILLSVKSVQVDAELLREISRSDATDYIISARFMMRNRPVTQ